MWYYDGCMSRHGKPLELSCVRTQPMRYLKGWEGRIELGGLTLLVAPPGTGKGLLEMEIIAPLSQTSRIMVSPIEDRDAEAFKPRAKAAGVNTDNVLLYSPRLPEGIAEWEALIRAEQVPLCVLDTLPEHFTHRTNDDVRVRDTLLQVAEMLERTDAAVLGILHPRKAFTAKAHPLQLIGGAYSGWAGVARQVCLVVRDGDRLTLVFAKGNNAPRANSVEFELDAVAYEDIADDPAIEPDGDTTVAFLRRVGASDLTPEEAVARLAKTSSATETAKARPKQAEAEEFLWSILGSGQEVPKKTVLAEAERRGIAQITLERAFRNMQATWRRDGFQGPVLWSLPAEVRDLALEEALENAFEDGAGG
jgi:hypothetical protein